jgi:hypothetical protein
MDELTIRLRIQPQNIMRIHTRIRAAQHEDSCPARLGDFHHFEEAWWGVVGWDVVAEEEEGEVSECWVGLRLSCSFGCQDDGFKRTCCALASRR